MSSQARKELERRRIVEDAYVHPPADLRSTRLSFTDSGLSVRRIASRARLVGFEVDLWGLIGTAPPRWKRRSPEDAQLSYWGQWGEVVTLRGCRPDAGRMRLGLQAFTVQWTRGGAPEVRVKFATYPVRKSSSTELLALLGAEVARMTPTREGVE